MPATKFSRGAVPLKCASMALFFTANLTRGNGLMFLQWPSVSQITLKTNDDGVAYA